MELSKKSKTPTCTKCRNHNIYNVPLKGHRKYCEFKECRCWKCELIEERRETNKRQRELNEAEAAATLTTETMDEQISLSIGDVKNQCDAPKPETTADLGEADTPKMLTASGEAEERAQGRKRSNNLDDKHKDKPSGKKQRLAATRAAKHTRDKRGILAPGLRPTIQHIQTHPYVGTPLAARVLQSPSNMPFIYPFNSPSATPVSATFTTMAHDSLLCSHLWPPSVLSSRYQGGPQAIQQTVAQRIGPAQAVSPSSLLMHGEVAHAPEEYSYEALDSLYWHLSPPNVSVSPRPSTIPRHLPAVVPWYHEGFCNQKASLGKTSD